MGERRRRSRVGQVVRRHIDCLNGSNGTVLRGSDTLLKFTDIRCQCRLISYCGRHTAQQRGNLGACLHETEDIVDEQKHVLMLLVTEILRHGKSGLRHTHTRSRRLVHLSEDQSGLLQNAGFFHLAPEIISLTGTLSHTGKNRISAVLRCNVCDQLLDQDGLSYAGAAEQTDLTALCVRSQQVDDLDTGLQHLYHRTLVFKARRISVDDPVLLAGQIFSAVDRVAQHVEQTPQCFISHRHGNAGACRNNFHILVKSLAG